MAAAAIAGEMVSESPFVDPMQARELSARLPNGITLAAQVWGADVADTEAIRVFCLHGWLDNSSSYAPFAEAVIPGVPAGSKVCIVSVDSTGHGHSSHRPTRELYYLYDYMDDFVAFLEAIGWAPPLAQLMEGKVEKKIVLIGHSMGGHNSMLISAAYPNLFSHVVLVESLGPIGVPSDNHTQHLVDYVKRQRAIHSQGASRKPLYASVEEAAVVRATKGIVPLTVEASRLLAERGLETVETPKGTMWSWRSDVKLTLRPPFRWSEEAVIHYMEAITAPVLIVIGLDSPFFLTMDDDPVFTKRIEALRKRGGGCEIVKVKGSHHPHLEPASKDEVARVIREFITK
ncbi:Alpha/Beta hydrolase protein [Hyaloraphidium curvatum]|nr:Alpha/Beta hydrolase protein [Hyaloraphidium curvatum]